MSEQMDDQRDPTSMVYVRGALWLPTSTREHACHYGCALTAIESLWSHLEKFNRLGSFVRFVTPAPTGPCFICEQAEYMREFEAKLFGEAPRTSSPDEDDF